MPTRSIQVILVLGLLSLASVAFGEGKFQRTKDDKTWVWNDDPKPGDEASWDGQRDKEGYAKGFGTLIWAKGENVFARYFGNMNRGKLDGAVNALTSDKTAHAFFANGKRITRWEPGNAPSHVPAAVLRQVEAKRQQLAKAEKRENAQRATSDAQHSIAEKPADGAVVAKTKDQPLKASKTENAQPSNPESPAEGPVVARTEIESLDQDRLAGQVQAAANLPKQSLAVTPAPVNSAAAKKSLPATAPHSGTDYQVAKPLPVSNPKPAKPPEAKPQPEKPAVAKSETDEKPAETRASAATGEKHPRDETSSTPPEQVDDSLQSLVRPPSGLRATSNGDISSETPPPDHGSEPVLDARATKEEAIQMADSAIRFAGYNLSAYHRSRTEYNAAADAWFLVYNRPPAEGVAPGAEELSISVDGTTKQTTILPGK